MLIKRLFRVIALVGATIGVSVAADFSNIRKYVYPVVIGQPTNSVTVQAIISSGSAIIIAPGYAVTAAHVVPPTPREMMSIHHGGQLIRATPVKIDHDKDLALLAVNIDCPCAPVATRALELDDVVYSVGFPMYLMYGVQFVTTGTVQGAFRGNTVTTSLTAPGGSGGGVFAKENRDYKLVGIAVAIAATPVGPRVMNIEMEHNWITFSVTVSTLRQFLKGTSVALR